MEKISFYIPCYNAESSIRECLDSVINQSYEIDEILVINDASTDKSIDIIKKYPVRIISHKENKGLAVCRNTAFREARNEFVASLDADCVASREWLAELMGCFTREDVAGAGGMLIERHALDLANRWRSVHMAQNWGRELVDGPRFLYGSNSIFKKSAIHSVGLYNEDFINNYEDIDISYRLYNNGFRLIYNPCARAEHLREDTIKSVLETYWRWSSYAHVNACNASHLSKRIVARILLEVEIFHKFSKQDLIERDYGLLFMDFLFLFYFPMSNLRCFLKKISQRKFSQWKKMLS